MRFGWAPLLVIGLTYGVLDVLGIWWAAGGPVILDYRRVCRKARRLRGTKAAALCDKRERDVLKAIMVAVRYGINECQHQLRYHKWNCTLRRRSLGKMLLKDTKEAAFIQAISAGAVTHVLARACSSGRLRSCTCVQHSGPQPPYTIARNPVDGPWTWEGCSDNLNYGYKISKDFMDADYGAKGSDWKTTILHHNNEAGRLMVRNRAEKRCKCHGLSGSCDVQTCWRSVPYLRDTGSRILEKFIGAVEVAPANDGSKLLWPTSQNKESQFQQLEKKRKLSEEDLVFAEETPNLCRRNRKLGILGTRGRECTNPYSQPQSHNKSLGDKIAGSMGACNKLCCGREYVGTEIRGYENCKCKFSWCCKVTCQKCFYNRTIFHCT